LGKNDEITYQNKDVTMKAATDFFKGQSFSIYGADVPEIVDVKPTNLPVIEANELRLDNLFLLKDGSYAIVDYESDYKELNKQKYLGYISQVVKKLYNLHGKYFRIRMVVIYTADVRPGMTEPILDLGAVRLEITEAFLIGMDSDLIYREAERELMDNGVLSEESMLKLIIYPLTFKGDKPKQRAIGRVIDLLDRFEDEEQKIFVAKYVLVFTDKVIDKSNAERIRRMIMLTKVEQIIEDEKKEAVNKAVKIADREARKKAKADKEEIVIKLLKTGDSAEKIADCTGLSIKEVEALASR